MKILIVSGFLGAGKTTFIKELIRRTNKNIVVMENEFGSASLDSSAVSGNGIDVLEFMEGCVCCTMKDSFVNSVLTVSATLDPEYLVIEPTGAAELGSVISSLKKICYEKITLADPVTILSPAGFYSNMNSCGGIFTDQIRHASIVVLSKTESADKEEISAVIREIREINPTAEIVTEHYTHKNDNWWNGLLESQCNPVMTRIPVRSRDIGLEEFTVKEQGFNNPAELVEMLRGLLWGYYGGVIRAKGVVKAGREWVRFDLADGMYSITGEMPDASSRAAESQDSGSENALAEQCVFIGRNINREKILSRFCNII